MTGLLMGVNHSLAGGSVTPPVGPTASPVLEASSEIFVTGGYIRGIRLSYPSGISAGDLLIAVAATRDFSGTLTELILDTNANWTRMINIAGADTGGEARMFSAWWKFADGDELDNVGITVGSLAGSALETCSIAAQMFRISGVDATDPIITPTTDVSAAAGESPFDSPTINAEDYSLVLPIVAVADAGGASTGLTIGNGATLIDESTADATSVDKVTLASAQKAITTGGATGAFTWSGTDSNDHFISTTIGVRGGSRSTFATPVTDSKRSITELLLEIGHSAATSVDTSVNAQTWSNLGGAPTFSFRGLGNGGYLTGGGGAMDFGNLTNLIPGASEEFCFEAWIWASDAGMGNGDSYFSIHSPTGNERCWDLTNWNASDNLTFYYSSDGTSFSSLAGAANTLSYNRWHHVAIERDSSDVMRMILDGVVVDSVTDSTAFHSTTASFLVGGRNGAASMDSGQRVSGIRLTLGTGATRYGGAFTLNDSTPGYPFPQS